jgi:hypothetical protein
VTNVQKPSVGRQVHYVPHGTPVREDGTQAYPSGACRTAVITEVPDNPAPGAEGYAGLCVTNPTGLFFHPLSEGGVAYDEAHAPGTWHWPERV